MLRTPLSSTIGQFPSLPIPSGIVAGVYRDASSQIRVQQGDWMIAYTAVPQGTTTTPTGWAAEYLLDDGGVVTGVGYNSATIATGVTTFSGPYSNALNATQNIASTPIPFAGTVKNFCFVTNTAQSAGGSLVATVFVNGSSTAVTATAATSAATGTFCDLTHSVAISTNQNLTVQFVNNGSGTSAGINGWSVEILPSSGTPGLIGGWIGSAPGSASTNFWQPFDQTSNGTETTVRIPMPRSGTTTNICVEVQAATANNPTLTLVKTGVATGLALTTTNATGVQCTTTGGPISWAQGDTMTLKIAAGTGTNPTLGGWSVNF